MSSRPKTGVREVLESLFATAQTQASAAATAIGGVVDDLTGETDRLRAQLASEKLALQATMAEADAVTPLLARYAALKQAYLEERQAFAAVEGGTDPRPALAALARLRTAAQQLAAVRAEHDLQNTAMLAIVDWRAANDAALAAALAQANVPDGLKPQHTALKDANQAFATSFAKPDYVEAEGLRVTLAARLLDFSQQGGTDLIRLDKAYGQLAGLAQALATKELPKRVATPHAELVASHEQYEREMAAAQFGPADQTLKALTDRLKVFEAKREEEAREVAARKVVDGWAATHAADVSQGLALEQVSPAIRATLRKLRPLHQQYEVLRRTEKFVEAEKCQAGLDTLLLALKTDKAAYESAAVEKKKADDERAKLDVRYEGVRNTAPLTATLASLVKAFKAADAAYEKCCYDGRYGDAVAALVPLEQAIVGLEGAAAEAQAASVKEEQARTTFVAALRKMQAVAGIKKNTLAIVALHADAEALTKRRRDEYAEKRYDAAIATAAEIAAKADEIKAQEAAATQAGVARDEMVAKWNATNAARVAATAIKASTTDLVRDKAALEEVRNRFVVGFNAFDNGAAALALAELPAAIKKVTDAKAVADVQDAKLKEAVKIRNKLDFAGAQERVEFAGSNEEAHRLDRAWDALESAYKAARDLPDADAALKAAKDLEPVFAELLRLDLQDLEDEADEKDDELADGWKALKSRFHAVRAYEPVSDPIRVLLERLTQEAAEFDKASADQEVTRQLAALKKLEITVDALEKSDYAAASLARYKAANADYGKNIKADYLKVRKLPRNCGKLKALVDRAAQEHAESGALLKADKPVAAEKSMAALKQIIVEINQAKADNDQAMLDFRAAYDGLLADYTAVRDFRKGRVATLDATITALPGAYDAAADAYNAGDGLEAMRLLPAYRAAVQTLVAGKALYDDCDLCMVDLGALAPALETARRLSAAGAPAPEFVPLLATFNAEWAAFTAPYFALKYTEARALLVPGGKLDAAARAIAQAVATQGQPAVDQGKQERKAVLDEWAKVQPNYDKVLAFKPFTPEIAQEQKTLRAAHAALVEALNTRLAFVESLAMLKAGGALFDAVKKLADREAEHANLASTAKLSAAKAGADIDGASRDDLRKTKTAEEKVQLIKDLAAEMKTRPSKEQLDKDPALKAEWTQFRARQIKLLGAMGLEDDFIKDDDAKKEELVRQMREDGELIAAKSQWNGRPPLDTAKRIAALRRAVAKQCALFGIDVPPIKEFSDPGDKAGVENGYFSSSTGAIFVNTHPNASLDNFEAALDLVIHENAHNYQFELVRRLQAGELNKGDPLYAQAQLFAVNAGLYVTPDEAYDTDKALVAYEQQPMEMHSFKTGPDVAKAFLKA